MDPPERLNPATGLTVYAQHRKPCTDTTQKNKDISIYYIIWDCLFFIATSFQ